MTEYGAIDDNSEKTYYYSRISKIAFVLHEHDCRRSTSSDGVVQHEYQL